MPALLEIGPGRQRWQLGIGLPAGAQLGVGAHDRAAQRSRRVGGDQLDPAGLVAGELLERTVEGAVDQTPCLHLVEHGEGWIQPRAERVGPEQAGAEPVDGRDVSALGGAGLGVGTAGAQALADPFTQLGGGLVGERDREDRADIDAVLEHRAGKPFDQYRGLAAARPGVEEQLAPAALDRVELFGGPALGVRRGVHDDHWLRQIPG